MSKQEIVGTPYNPLAEKVNQIGRRLEEVRAAKLVADNEGFWDLRRALEKEEIEIRRDLMALNSRAGELIAKATNS